MEMAAMNRRNFLTGSALAAVGGPMLLGTQAALVSSVREAAAQSGGIKPPSEFTKAANKKVLASLPFNDRTDFERAQRGFIAGLPDGVIKNAEGKVVFDANAFKLPLDRPAPDTMNPSLWRVFQLDGISGLFKVVDRIYQVRSIEIANITFIEGDTGIIVVDTMQSTESAKAGLDLYFAHRPKKPIVAVIHTHSHIDHFAGVGALITQDDADSGNVKVVAPAGFIEEAVSENLYAGNAMFRRATYQYGSRLAKGSGPEQTLGTGLGVTGVSSPMTLVRPTHTITETGQKMTIDGLEFEFLMAPGSEAPSEMHLYISNLKALCPAENATHTMHNFYTLRGAKTRDISKWVSYLNQTLEKWGDTADVLFAPHMWPIWGNAEIRTHIENYRDAFKFIHDRSLHLANRGYTMPEIGDMVVLPEALQKNWATRGYYGTVSHNARAVYNFYLGYFSGNPAELNPLPPIESAPRYVEMMGGAEAILTKAGDAYKMGEYRWVAQLLEHLVYAQPDNQAARNLMADAFEQMSYQTEAATWRNIYVVGAKELREGTPKIQSSVRASADMIRNLPLTTVFDYLAIAMDSEKAVGRRLSINFETNENEKYNLRLRNSVLNAVSGHAQQVDLTVSGPLSDINALLMGGDPKKVLESGKLKTNGELGALGDLLSLVTTFDLWFPIVTRPKLG
jgi:alkyl sulfatase BDS1-like metallo-beta-lactamase superfamily hydrolase